MGTQKKSKKPRKQLPKKAGKGPGARDKEQQRIEALKQERRLLKAQIAELQRRLREATEHRVNTEPAGEPPKCEVSDQLSGIEAAEQEQINWDRFSYLNDRYEFYTEDGVDKARARKLANADLVNKFGDKAGYTDEQLECIFL